MSINYYINQWTHLALIHILLYFLVILWKDYWVKAIGWYGFGGLLGVSLG